MAPIIELEELTFYYLTQGTPALNYKNQKPFGAKPTKRPDKHDKREKVIFSNFSLKIEQGARLIVKGSSGAGKSTLLRLLAWLEEPVSGRISFNGKPYETYYPPALRKMVSLVGQKPVMLDGTVRRNLLLGCDEEPSDETLHDWLQLFGLEKGMVEKSAATLSVGEQQRVAVIRNLLIKPRVLLLDEPTSGLDPESTGMFLSAMRNLAKKNDLTLIWNSHNYSEVKSIATDTLTIKGVKAK